MRNIAAVKPCSMFRLTIPLVAGIFVSDHFFKVPCLCLFWHGNIGVLDWFDCIGEMARLPFPMVIWRHVFMFLFCIGALLVQQNGNRWTMNGHQGRICIKG